MKRATRVFVLLGSHSAAAVRISAHGAELLARCESIRSLASELRTRRGIRRVSLTLDTSLAQIRMIDGLPSTSDARSLRAVLMAAPHRYFLRTSGPPLVSHVQVLAPGMVRAALCDSQVLDELGVALRQSGIRVARVAASERAATIAAAASVDVVVIAELESDALSFPKASAQTRSGNRIRAWKPRARGVVVAAVLILASAIAPMWKLHASRISQVASHSDGSVVREVALAAHLDSLRQPLAALREQADAASHPLLLLGAISSMLPSDGKVLDFAVDSTGAQLTITTASLQPFLRRLERLRQYDVALASDISADTGSAGGERATIILRARRMIASRGGH